MVPVQSCQGVNLCSGWPNRLSHPGPLPAFLRSWCSQKRRTRITCVRFHEVLCDVFQCLTGFPLFETYWPPKHLVNHRFNACPSFGCCKAPPELSKYTVTFCLRRFPDWNAGHTAPAAGQLLSALVGRLTKSSRSIKTATANRNRNDDPKDPGEVEAGTVVKRQ